MSKQPKASETPEPAGEPDAGDKLDPLSIRHWRYETLTKVGYTPAAASLLAERVDIDLHQACVLLRQGAREHTVLRILL